MTTDHCEKPEEHELAAADDFLEVEANQHLDQYADEQVTETMVQEKRQEESVHMLVFPNCKWNPHPEVLLGPQLCTEEIVFA